MRVAFNFSGPNKLEKIGFNNIAAMKIIAVFECDSTNNSSFFHEARHRQILSKMLVKVAS